MPGVGVWLVNLVKWKLRVCVAQVQLTELLSTRKFLAKVIQGWNGVLFEM